MSASVGHLSAANASQYHHEMSTSCCHANHIVQEHGRHRYVVSSPHGEYSALEHTAGHCCHTCHVERSHIPMHKQLSPSHMSYYQAQRVCAVMQPSEPIWHIQVFNNFLWTYDSYMPACVVQWLDHSGAMCSTVWRVQCAAGPEFSLSHDPVRRVRLRKK